MALSDKKLKEIVSNFILFCIVVLSWTYTILAGKAISEKYLHTLEFEQPRDFFQHEQQSRSD
jgi:hypothetical protein